MRKAAQVVFAACVVWLSTSGWSPVAQAADDPGIKFQINDELVSFGASQPYLDETGNLMVPVRPVAEKVGYSIEGVPLGGQTFVRIEQKAGRAVTFITGESKGIVDGKEIPLAARPASVDGTVYAPVRSLADALGLILQWDDKNGIAILAADGQYHAPAWYAPKKHPVIDTAFQYMGVPYVWGGSTPEGFDCSGFVRYVYRKHGLELPRTSREMYAQLGSPTASPEVGDLVFFAHGRDYHVGIYLGESRFISATTSHGIHVDDLNSAYWNRRYIGAKKL